MKLQRIDFEPNCGEIMERYAERAVLFLAEKQEKSKDLELYLVGEFNGIKIITSKYSTVDSIVADYHIRMDISVYEYKQTDEYKKNNWKEKKN